MKHMTTALCRSARTFCGMMLVRAVITRTKMQRMVACVMVPVRPSQDSGAKPLQWSVKSSSGRWGLGACTLMRSLRRLTMLLVKPALGPTRVPARKLKGHQLVQTGNAICRALHEYCHLPTTANNRRRWHSQRKWTCYGECGSEDGHREIRAENSCRPKHFITATPSCNMRAMQRADTAACLVHANNKSPQHHLRAKLVQLKACVG